MKKFAFLILSLINTAVLAIYIASAPVEIVPTHYGINGTADAFSSKWTLLILTVIPVIFGIIFIIYRTITENKENYKANRKYENRSLIAIFVMFIAFTWIFTIPCLNNVLTISTTLIIPLVFTMISIIIIILSNVFPKLKQNSSFGIKINATLKSENIWKKTHKLAGYTGVICGIVTVIVNLVAFFIVDFVIISTIISLVTIILGIGIIPTIYAESLYLKEKKRNINREWLYLESY